MIGPALQIPTARVFTPALEHGYRYIAIHGGRGSAKSHFFGGMAVEDSIRKKTNIVCLREVQKSLKFSVKKLIENKIVEMNAGWYFDVKDEEIRSTNGGVMIFQGMQNSTAESIKSLEDFDTAWFEEAQTASQNSLDMLRPTLRKPGSQLWFSWNPRNKNDPVDQLFRSGEPLPRSCVIEANYLDNPWFPDELREEMEYDKRRDPDKYAHIWLGQYEQNSEARVFKNWTIREFDVEEAWTLRGGADWGFSIDPTVGVQCAIVGRTIYVCHEVYRIGCEITDTPALFMEIPGLEKWPLVADSARPETISHMRRNGFPKITAAVKGKRSLEEGVEWLQSYDIVVHPRCVHTIDELTLYKFKTDPLTGAVLPVLEDKDNHVIDALRYACEGARRAMRQSSPVEVEVVAMQTYWGRR